MTIPLRFIKKIGKIYRVYSLKGRYDEKTELEDSLHFGRKIVAKKEAENYKRWQNNVNHNHAIVVKHGTIYVVYISSSFKTMHEAENYMTRLEGSTKK